jgi:alkylated DNA repair dioxygenase AlkB
MFACYAGEGNQMNTLFPIEPQYPEGFTYTPDFISAEEEKLLIAEVKKIELHNFVFQGYTANRRVASFGYDYSFENGKLTKGDDIPAGFNFLVKKVGAALAIPDVAFAELLVIEYPPGTVINWHRDAPPFDVIAGISLLSDCTFRLRPQEKFRQKRSAVLSFPVRRRSLYKMEGGSRSDWQHSIMPVKETRYSITLRTLREQLV